MQPRSWLDEAQRCAVVINGDGSWLSASTHQQVLFVQNPYSIRRFFAVVLHARLIAAELRGSPWPIDVLDRTGAPLRRWEKDGRLIGAYSVGPDGVDDGGDPKKDIQLRLTLEAPASVP